MNKTMKKTLFILLSVMMIATLMLSASATTTVDSGTIGERIAWTLDSDGKLTITGEGDIPIYNEEDVPWKDAEDYNIKTVEIGEGITTVPYYAFFRCYNLESVSLPDSLTKIDSYAFALCPKLESIEIPYGVEDIRSYVFARTGLKSIKLPDSVIYIGSYIFNDTPLETVTLSKKLVWISSNAFGNCDSLKKLVIPESVTSIGNGAFYDCDVLEEVIIPDSVETIESEAFKLCEALKELELPASLKTIGSNAFYSSGITSLTLPEGLTTLHDEALAGTDVTGILVIPDSVTSIGKDILSRTNVWELVLGSGMETVDMESFNQSLNLIIPEEVKKIAGSDEYIYYIGVHYMGEKENLTVEDERLRAVVHCIEYIDAVGPTCVKDGHEAGYYCKDCDAYFINTGAATGELATGVHIYEEYKSDNNATCLKDETKTANCKYNCGEKDIVTVEGSALGHNEVVIPAVPSTCTETGKTEGMYCDRCNMTLVYPQLQNVIPHKYENYEIYKPATCFDKAWERAFCEYGCNSYTTRRDDDGPYADHILSEEWEGYKEGHYHRCTVCTYLVDETAHTYGEWQYFPATNLAGEIVYEKMRHCTVCDYPETVEISKEEYQAATQNSDNCDHLCHKGGFMGFIWKIVRFFNKLFKSNPVCECGAAHY